MSLVGSSAPHFELQSTKDLDMLDVPVRLDEFRGRWLVLVFYPADFTFVCPTEMLAFSAAAEEFAEENAAILGISTDGVHCHQAWQEFVLGTLAFPLAADPSLATTRDYGVLIESEGVARRALFIIDPDGMIRYEVVHDSDVGRSVTEALRVLRALRTEVLVPVDWAPGLPTLAETT